MNVDTHAERRFARHSLVLFSSPEERKMCFFWEMASGIIIVFSALGSTCRDHSVPLLLGCANMAPDRMVTILGVLARGANNVHLVRLNVSVQMFMTCPLLAVVRGDEVSPPSAYCSETGKKWHVFVQSCGRSLCAVASAAQQLWCSLNP